MTDSPHLPVSQLVPTRVLIADDHPMMVDGLRYLLETYGFEVVGTVGDGQAAVSEALRLEPDLVLMDITMPVCNGLDATRLIKAQRPDMKIVMLTTSAEYEDLFEAIKSGATGYLLKVTTGPAFIEALHGLEQGIPPFSPGLAELLLREFARLSESAGKEQVEAQREGTMQGESQGDVEKFKLTDRQTEVLRLVAAGLTYRQAGEKLCLSEATVRYHMIEIMHLLHLENRNQVIAYAGELRSAGKLGFTP
jgi:DNA-binding NarL/FixJ family response regulator